VNPLIMGALDSVLTQSGGIQGLASQFSQAGQSGTFYSWVGMGENQSISADQIQKVLGSDQINALAAKMGLNSTQTSQFLAEYLPKVVDKLTPEGRVNPMGESRQGLAALLPSLLQSLSGKSALVDHIEPSHPWPIIPPKEKT